jgi:hypothetical protein
VNEHVLNLSEIPKCPICGVLLTRYISRCGFEEVYVYDPEINGYRATADEPFQSSLCPKCKAELPKYVAELLSDNEE